VVVIIIIINNHNNSVNKNNINNNGKNHNYTNSCDNNSEICMHTHVGLSTNNETSDDDARIPNQHVVKKVDSGCSHSMSGVPDRLTNISNDNNNITITGFNGSNSKVDIVGLNEDNISEFYVSNMPNYLVLLCAQAYAKKYGAVVLLENEGYIIEIPVEHRKEFVKFILDNYEVIKNLIVVKNTYEVVENHELENDLGGSDDIRSYGVDNYALFNKVKYFNTKINFSNVEELVTAYLLCGFTISDMLNSIKHNTVNGLHPSINEKALHSYAYKWGASVDAFQLAVPNIEGNRKGYMVEKKKVTKCGEMVEMDFFESPYNEEKINYNKTKSNINNIEDRDDGNVYVNKRIKKLPTHGGATACSLFIDVYSGYIKINLVQTTSKSIQIVRENINFVQMNHHQVETFAADTAINIQSMFKTYTNEVQQYLLEQKIKSITAEPYNHSNGTPHVEHAIREVGTLIRMAIQYVLRDGVYLKLGFTKRCILQLWGEIANWATVVLNLRTCVNDKTKSKYEVFTGIKPNVQQIRMLPIFAVVLVLRQEQTYSFENSFRPHYIYAYYVGPSMQTPGAIRAAYVHRDVSGKRRVYIITTTKYTNVQDGGGVDIYPIVNKGFGHILHNKTFNEVETNQLQDDNNSNMNDNKLDKNNNHNQIKNDNNSKHTGRRRWRCGEDSF
jgi:hypothetical protein